MDAPELSDSRSFSKEVKFGEHEFHLAFNGDLDCERFQEWLRTIGWRSFQKYWYRQERLRELEME